MLVDDEFVEVGYIRKGHGYKGHARVVVFEEWEKDLADQKFIFFQIDGYKVPFAISERQENKDLILKFSRINSVEDLKQYHKRPIFLLKKDIRHAHELIMKNEQTNKLIEYNIIDLNLGDLGPIIRIDEYPQQEMAVLKGKDGKEVLIPLHESLIIEQSTEEKFIKMDLPEGLV